MTRLILFDIDLTLIQTAGAGRTAMETAFERLYGVTGATSGVGFDGRTDWAIFTEVIERHGVAEGSLEAALSEFAEAYLAEFPRFLAEKGGRVLPGVPELLDALDREVPGFGLATGNLRRGAAAKLGHFGLWERFAGGGFGDSHTVRAELVKAGIAELADVLRVGADPANAIVLGDTPLDVEAAHRAGARALGVGTGRFSAAELSASGAEFAVDDLQDTARLLDILLG
ncbi:MAG: HAD hydrolase-like protein [Chloroflexi bacterium]|nr:HAD hydrolase-like protein [Chloroflexota bacterium]